MNTKIEINADELPLMREKIMKCKIICLDEMEFHPLINPKYINDNKKKILLNKIKLMLENETDENITIKFNQICNEKLLDNKSDYSSYPVYVDTRDERQKNKAEQEDKELKELNERLKRPGLIELLKTPKRDIAGNIIQ